MLRPIYKLFWFERAERKALFQLAKINEIHNQNKYGIQHRWFNANCQDARACHLSEQNYYAISPVNWRRQSAFADGNAVADRNYVSKTLPMILSIL